MIKAIIKSGNEETFDILGSGDLVFSHPVNIFLDEKKSNSKSDSNSSSSRFQDGHEHHLHFLCGLLSKERKL